MPIYEFKCQRCGVIIEEMMTYSELEKSQQFGQDIHVGAPGKKTRTVGDEICGGTLDLIPSLPRFNCEFPTQSGGVHSMAGFGKRRRDRQGD